MSYSITTQQFFESEREKKREKNKEKKNYIFEEN